MRTNYVQTNVLRPTEFIQWLHEKQISHQISKKRKTHFIHNKNHSILNTFWNIFIQSRICNCSRTKGKNRKFGEVSIIKWEYTSMFGVMQQLRVIICKFKLLATVLL